MKTLKYEINFEIKIRLDLLYTSFFLGTLPETDFFHLQSSSLRHFGGHMLAIWRSCVSAIVTFQLKQAAPITLCVIAWVALNTGQKWLRHSRWLINNFQCRCSHWLTKHRLDIQCFLVSHILTVTWSFYYSRVTLCRTNLGKL